MAEALLREAMALVATAVDETASEAEEEEEKEVVEEMKVVGWILFEVDVETASMMDEVDEMASTEDEVDEREEESKTIEDCTFDPGR